MAGFQQIAFGVGREERARSLVAVLAAHALVLWLVASLVHTSFVRERDASVDVFDVRPLAPPPQAVRPVVAPRREGVSAPARPAARQAEPVLLPVAAGILPASGGQTAAISGGPEARVDGTGGGGTGGNGAGLGSAGTGSGGLRPAVAVRLRGGRIEPRDYPRSAGGAQGAVTAHVAVGADGRVTGCAIARSSGNAILDATTCRLIRERFRFTPARNARGEAVPGEFGWQQRWWRD